MRTIHKFTFTVADTVTLGMPKGAVIRKVGKEVSTPGGATGKLAVWVEVDTDQPMEQRPLYVRGTGHPMPTASRLRYVDMVQDGPLVWHVWEVQRVTRSTLET